MKKRKLKLYIFLFVVIAIACVVALLNVDLFKVKHIRITGTDKITNEQMEVIMQIDPNTSIIAVDREKIKAKVEEYPYLIYDGISISFPDTVVVNVKEKKPAYYIEHLENYIAVNIDGVVINAENHMEFSDVPFVTGMKLNSFSIGNRIDTSDVYQLELLKEILVVYSEANITSNIKSISISDMANIYLHTKDDYDVNVGSREKMKRKVEWVVTVIPQLKSMNKLSGTIDISTGENPTFSEKRTNK